MQSTPTPDAALPVSPAFPVSPLPVLSPPSAEVPAQEGRPVSHPTGPDIPDTPRSDASGRIEFVHRSWPADPAQLSVIRRELSTWLAPLALSDDETADVVLAVDEAAANAVRHAYGPGRSGVVELTLWTEPGTLCVEVVDHGNWRPPATPTPRGAAGDSGRGMTLMSSMADAVLIHYDARGSRVLLRHHVPGAAGWLDDGSEEAAAEGPPAGDAPVDGAPDDDGRHVPTAPLGSA